MRSRFPTQLVTLLLVMFVVIAAPRPAHAACTCTATNAEQGMADASVVFLGSLTDISAPGADGLVTLDFDVRLVYKGDSPASAKVATFATTEQCGLGETARRGDWLVFAYVFPGDTESMPLLSSCSPSKLLTSGSPLPVEIGAGKAPPGAEAYVPVDVGPAVQTFVGSVTDPRQTAIQIGTAGAALLAIGVVARVLAGRRRVVVR